MTKRQLLDRMKLELGKRSYTGMTQQQYISEAVDVMFDVIAEALAARPLLTLKKK